MPLVKGDVHGNIRELVAAGHPQKQAVAIALRLAGRRGKVKLAKVPQNFEDRGFSMDDITGGVIHRPSDHLEHLDTIERERGKGHWMTHALRVLQNKRIAGDLPHNPNVSRANPRAMPKKFVLTPQNDEGTHPYWFMGHWGDEEQPHFHIGYARTEGNSVKRSNGRTTPVPLHPEEATTFLDPAIAHAEQHGHKQTKKMLEGLKKEAVKRWGKAQPTITSTEEHMWPHVADEHMRGVLADHLEEMGDPLHHFLRVAHPDTFETLTGGHPGVMHGTGGGGVLTDRPRFYHPHITHIRTDRMNNGTHDILARVGGGNPVHLRGNVSSDIAHQIAERLTGKPTTLSREQDALWPQINDEGARLALADHLEEIGDPLHHVLRNEIHYPEGIGDHKFLWVPHSHPHINSLAINYYPGKNWHSVILHSTPHEQELPALRGKVTTEQLKDILHQHWDRTKNKEGYDRSALYRSGIFSPKEMRENGYIGLSRPDVIADANSQAQDIRKFIAAKIAKEARLKLVGLEDARGQDTSGVVQAYEAPGDEEGVDYAAAWYGLLTNQPKVTTFHENDQGPDTFYKWKVAGDPDQALKTLPPGTIITKDNFAHYLDRGSQKPVDGAPGVRGTAVTMQGRQGYRDFIKKYQGPDDNKVTLAASSVIVKVPLPQPVSQAPQQPPTLKKPSPRLSYVLPF